MLFSSAIFIFGFLPLCFVLFYAVRRFAGLERALWCLMLMSLVFYSYWYPPYLILLLTSIIFNFLLGKVLCSEHPRRKALLVMGVALNLVAIFYFKYAGFVATTINWVSPWSLPVINIALPLGISFFTFQQITYLVDSYEGKTRDHKFGHYALFVSFFPQLIAGPIVHHSEVIPQFLEKKRVDLASALGHGLSIFAFGLFKKIVIADGLAPYANTMFSTASGGTVDFVAAIGGVMAYTFQLYFDFSGYSDMAIGLGKMFGINIPLNFNSPYKATSISDFWRRWHMTLSRFLRDYVYIPMGGSRHGAHKTYRNLFLTMVIGGIWHGAGWAFIVWGALHGLYLLINHWYRIIEAKLHFPAIHPVVARIITFACVVWGWVFFRASTLQDGVQIARSLVGLDGIILPERFGEVFGALQTLGVQFYGGGAAELVQQWISIGGAILIAFFMPNVADIFGILSGEKVRLLRWKPNLIWGVLIGAVLFLALREACFVQSSDFLYFDF